MLILTRKPGQSINIGPDIVVTVVERIGSQIRIGIEAPKDIPIHRDDIGISVQKRPNRQDMDCRDREACRQSLGNKS